MSMTYEQMLAEIKSVQDCKNRLIAELYNNEPLSLLDEFFVNEWHKVTAYKEPEPVSGEINN